MDWLLRIIWPPYAFRRKMQEENARQRAGYAKWYREVYIPYITKTWPEERLKEYRKELVFKKWIRR